MTPEELDRKTVLEQAKDKRITQKEGAEKLGISERYFRSLLERQRRLGDEGLVSGHRGKASNHRMKEAQRQEIKEFMGDPIYADFGPTLMAEKLEEHKGIKVSKETMRQMMIEAGKHRPKKKKKVMVHPQRERRVRRGELVQIDGSYHAWLEDRGPKGCLLLFVDDATSEVLAAEFVEHESFFAYARLCKSYFQTIGTPVAFYSDKFSVFRVNSNNVTHKEAITQFSRALGSMGIELICANSPQAKGRVERANQTFQDRLVKELRIQRVNNFQDANAYLPTFIQFYNRKFAVLPRSAGDVHAALDPTIDLDFLFSIHASRMISKDLQIQFNTVVYQILTHRPQQHLIGREVLITQNQSGDICAYLNQQLLTLNVFHKQPKQAQIVSTKSIDPHVFTPAVDHPWRSYGKKLNGRPILVSDL
jgi:DNA-binding Lrp family transcriptional regulator